MTVWGSRIRGGLFMAASLALAFLMLAAPQAAQAGGYTGAQAEAQGDTGVDPYSFPKINLCCERRPGHHGGHGGGQWGGSDDDDHHKPRTVRVDCAVPTEPRHTFGSVQEAVAFLKGEGTVLVSPGAPCEVSGLQLSSEITIATDRYGYGSRARLVAGDSCISVSSGRYGASATFGGIDVDACVTVRSGNVRFDEVNLAWRGDGPAVNVYNGSVVVDHSTVRARNIALNAESAGRIAINASTLATTAAGPNVIRVAASRVELKDVRVKGGTYGLVFDQISEVLNLESVNVYRTEAGDPNPPSENGAVGVLISGTQSMQDLPWVPGLENRRVHIVGGSVSGYSTGIQVGPGSSAEIREVTINGGFKPISKGISVAAGSNVDLVRNQISGIHGTGIYYESGSRGTAARNEVKCVHGRCVCYGGDCSSRSNYTFGNGALRMTDTDCDD